jgi:excisionase family DNA binding protein
MKHEAFNYEEIEKRLTPELLEAISTLVLRVSQQRSRSPWFTLKEAGEYLRCGVTTVRRLIDEGQLRSHRLDQRVEKSTILLHRKDMDALVLCGRSRGLQPREQKLVRTMQM